MRDYSSEIKNTLIPELSLFALHNCLLLQIIETFLGVILKNCFICNMFIYTFLFNIFLFNLCTKDVVLFDINCLNFISKWRINTVVYSAL